MDDHSGNIIYIIAILIAAISSIASKIKKSANSDKPLSPSTPTRSWQDVIREITMEHEESPTVEMQPEPKPLPVSQKKGKIETKPFLDTESKIHGVREVARPAGVTLQLLSPEDEQTGVSLPDFSSFDDIKRGIVFNEIFTRKF